MTFPSQRLSQDISLLINEISMSLEIMLNEMFMKVKVCSVVLGKKTPGSHKQDSIPEHRTGPIPLQHSGLAG